MALPESTTMNSQQVLIEPSTDIEEDLFGADHEKDRIEVQEQRELSDGNHEPAAESSIPTVSNPETMREDALLANVAGDVSPSADCPLRSGDNSIMEQVPLQDSATGEDTFPVATIAGSIAEALQSNVTDLPPVTMPTSVSVAAIEVPENQTNPEFPLFPSPICNTGCDRSPLFTAFKNALRAPLHFADVSL
jgi:hypothetical protein